MDSAKQTGFAIHPDRSQPLYLQVQTALREAVDKRILKRNSALSPERELASEFGVSRITVRKAIAGLVAEGVLETRHGSGTFVRSRVEKNFAQLSAFSQEMAARGKTPSSLWLGKSAGRVTPAEAMALRVSPGTRVYRFQRVRLADEAPMSVEYATILAHCLPSIDAVKDSLYAALQDTGQRPVKALQRLRALLLEDRHAELLGAAPGDAGLLVERVGFNRDGVASEFSRSYYRGDTYDFVAELTHSD